MMFFVLLFLALQLLGASSHTHAYTEHEPDCAACSVVHLPTGGVPPVALSPAAPAPQAGLALVAPQAVAPLPQAHYLFPPSHAPPGVAVFSV